MRQLVLSGFFLIICISTGQAQIDYFSAPNLLQFADYLAAQADYERAAGEYSRFLIAYPDSSTEHIVRQLIQCYDRAHQPENGLAALTRFGPSNTDWPCTWRQLEARLLLRAHQFDSLDHWSTEHTICVTDSVRTWLALAALRQHRWEAARGVIQALDDDLPTKLHLTTIHDEAIHLPQKSPVVAGLLAAVIPGSGKLYLGRKMDALLSFVLTGTMAWRSAVAFDEDGTDSTAGWVYGGFGTFFYLGNVYGSYIGAKVYNHNQWQAMDARIDAEIKLMLD